MKIEDVVKRAFAMPLTSPAFPPGPYRFIDREYLIITYRTDKAALEAVVPEPLTFDDPIVKYEFIRMPNSTGFGDYTESGQVIPVRFKGVEGGVFEIALKYRGDAFRSIYAVKIAADVWVIHAFQKKSKKGIKTPQIEVDLIVDRLRRLKDAIKHERG